MDAHGVASEVGRLGTVMLHRPGSELRRLTPRNNDQLLFDGVPWVDRAQAEHDAFAGRAARPRRRGALRARAAGGDARGARGARAAARRRARPAGDRPHARGAAARAARRARRRPSWPRSSWPGSRTRSCPVSGGLVDRMTAPQDFIVRPLPNLLFTRDSSVWLDHGVAVTALAMGARRRETTITAAIYTHHPRFARHGAALRRRPAARRVAGGRRRARPRARACSPSASASAPARPGVEAFAQRLFAAEAAARGARRPDRPGPRDHAPRHRLHDGRPRRRRHVPAAGRLARRPTWSSPAPATACACRGPEPFLPRRPPRWGSARCASSTPGSTP